VRAEQRRGDFDFSVKVSEIQPDRRYDGNTPFGLRWRVPNVGDTPETEVRILGDNRQRREQWFEAHEVQLTEPHRVVMTTFLPWLGQAPWVRLEWPHKWAAEMSVLAELQPRQIDIHVDNVSSFRLLSKGALENLNTPHRLSINGSAVGTLQPGFGEVRLSASNGESGSGAESAWDMSPAEPIDWDTLGFVGHAGQTLNRESDPPTWDSPLGNWFCDAMLFSTGADVAFQNNTGMRTDMEYDAISIRDLFAMNFPNDLQTFQRSGAELLDILEHDVRNSRDRPMQIAGVSYSFDRSRPEGQRIVATDIDPDASYTIVAQAYLVQRGSRFFGADIEDWTNTGTQTVDAQVRYVQHQGTVMAPPAGRIREVNAP
jgi:hypothetical protein